MLDKNPTKGKFDPRGTEGLFMGYSEQSKAYRIWIPSQQKVIVSRDVKFTAQSYPSSRRQDFKQTDVGSSDFVDSEQNDETADVVAIQGPNTTDKLAASQKVQLTSNESSCSPARSQQPTTSHSPVSPNPESERSVNSVDTSSDSLGSPFMGFKGYVPGGASEDDSPLRGFEALSRRGGDQVDSSDDDDFHDASCVIATAEIPLTTALSGAERDDWMRAICDEFRSLISNGTWELIDKPKDAKIVGCRTVLRIKHDADGSPIRRKARVVSQGFSQRPGVDYAETFAPVARIESLRMLAAIAVKSNLEIHQLDIVTAYLNGDIDTNIYMRTPALLQECLAELARTEKEPSMLSKVTSMLKALVEGEKVCKLRKALYGLRQAGRQWHTKIDSALKEVGMHPTNGDPCVYVDRSRDEVTYLLLYVDDILIASRNPARVNEIKSFLSSRFDVKDIGKVSYCLGIEVEQTLGKITLSQRGFVRRILERFGMTDCKPVGTPMALGGKLEEALNTIKTESFPYREIIGALMYLSVGTRPDIAHAVNYLSQFNNNHDDRHWKAAKRILRYLKGTIDKGLVYQQDDAGLVGMADADWGNSEMDRKSYTGYAFIMSGGAVSWCSRKQRTVAQSSTEAEYMCLSEAAKEAIFCISFVKELGCPELANITLFNDNQSAGKLARNPVFHSRTKHIDIKCHFIRDAIKDYPIQLEYLPTEEMTADVLTTPLSIAKHEKCTVGLGLHNVK